MKKTGKIITAVVCIGMLSSLAVSCGNKTADSENGSKKTITILTSGRSDAEFRQQQIDEFNQTNEDNIYIDFQVKADDFVDALMVAYQANAAPDIHPSHYKIDEGAVSNNWYRELDEDTIKRYTDKLLIPNFNYAYNKKGEKVVFGVMTGGISSHRFIWNKDLFAECGLDPNTPPKTWDKLMEYAKIITEKGAGQKYGFALPLKSNGFIHYYVLNPSVPSGVKLINGYNPVEGKYDFTPYAPMVDFMKQIQANGYCFPSPSTIDNDTARAQFSEGNVGMMFAASWDVAVFNEQFPAKCDWGIADFPTFTGEVTGGYPGSVASGGSFVMSKQSKNPDEQYKVWDWYIGEELSTKIQNEGLATFCYKSLVGDDKLNTEKKGAKELFSVSSPAFLLEGIPNTPNLTKSIKVEGDAYADTIAGIIKGNLDTKSTLETLTERYNQALDRYIEKEKPDESRVKDPNWNGIVDINELLKK